LLDWDRLLNMLDIMTAELVGLVLESMLYVSTRLRNWNSQEAELLRCQGVYLMLFVASAGILIQRARERRPDGTRNQPINWVIVTVTAVLFVLLTVVRYTASLLLSVLTTLR
jgi:hypothetical protein